MKPLCPIARLSRCIAVLLVLLLSTSPSGAGEGSVDTDGGLNLNLHFRFAPTQSDIDRVQAQLQRASQLMCDATEGEMKIASARLSAGGADEPAGDIWYYPPGAINRSRSAGRPVHSEANRIYLQYANIRSDVLFHELGHLVFGLGDQYNEQRRAGGACGIGPAFDSDILLDERNHTIMQQPSFQRCVTSGGERTSTACYDDADCESGETCPLPDLSSEFSMPANNDLLRGDNALAVDTCPEPRAGDTYRVNGFLGAAAPMVAFDSTDLETARDTSFAETAREYVDELGVLTGWDADSAHPIWLFTERVGPQAWTLHFGMDGKHLAGETEGELITIGSVDIEFEATPSEVVPVPGLADQNHRVVVSAGGQLLSDPGYTPPTITIPDLVGMAGSQVLELNFDELTERDGSSGWSVRNSEITSGEVQQLGICEDTTACEGRWNSITQRWEASAATSKALQNGDTPLSEWEQIIAGVEASYNLQWSLPTNLPTETPHPSHDCNAAIDFEVEVDGLDQVYLMVDRSWSMHEERDWLGASRSRLDWAKAGARGFAELMVDEGVEVGLISFNTSVVENLPLANVVEDGAGTAETHEIDELTDAIDALQPDLNTAIGDALDLARNELAAAAEEGRAQAVLLLSDGAQNAGTLDPSEVAEGLREDGVRVYAVPLGNDADGELLERVAETTGGTPYDADSPDELPPLYAQQWGRLRGESPIWAAVESEPDTFIGALAYVDHIIPVEVGSERLSVMLSGRGEDTWNPTCQLTSPSGVIAMDCAGSEVQSDPYYRIFRVETPEPGFWNLRVIAYQQPPQRSYVWAHSDGPGPDCWAGVEDPVLEETPAGGTVLRASASSGAPLGRDVLYAIQVETPNGTKLPVETMSINERENGAEYLFDQFAGRGQYEVLVTCIATNNSRYAPGERVDLVEILEEDDPIGFVRQAKTAFFLDIPEPPPIPPGDDCDGDGVTNSATPNGFDDDDGDGIQNYCDTDDDNDDVPDTEDLCPDEDETFGEFTEGRDPIDGCAVPEPGVTLMLAFGTIGLTLSGRFRSRRTDR